MYLADFDYEIKYIRGEDNAAADALSCMPDSTPNLMFAACALAHTRSPPPPRVIAATTFDITPDESLLRDITAGYQNDEFAKQLWKDISAGSIEGAQEENHLLYMGHRLLIPNIPQIQELLYNLAHDTLGHFGFDKSYEALRDSYYWPNMRQDLKQAYIPSCSPCQCNKSRTTKPTSPLHPLPVPDAHFKAIALDFVGPLPEEGGKEHRAPKVQYKDLVMLSTENQQCNYKQKDKKRITKFMPWNDGPYTVIKSFPKKSEYTLQLPNNPQTFPGFHSSLLKPFIPPFSLTRSSPDRALLSQKMELKKI